MTKYNTYGPDPIRDALKTIAREIAREMQPLIEEMVEGALTRKALEADPLESYPALMTKAQVAEFFGKDRKTIYNWTRDGALPQPVRKGRELFYEKAAIRAAMKDF